MAFQRRPDRRGPPRPDDRRPRDDERRSREPGPYTRRDRGTPEHDSGAAGGRRPTGGPRAGGPPRPRVEADLEPGMTIRLDPPRLRELQRLARDAGLRPGQLAQRWVEERLAVGPAGASAAGAPGGARDDSQTDGSPELDRLSELVADHTARLDHLAAQVAALTAAPPQQPATDRGDSGRRPRLHEEILAVLRESGRAMSAGEIAQAIRDRGNYRAPRSNEQVNGAMVSGRVSNPHYRSLFVRDGRRIGLVEHAGGR